MFCDDDDVRNELVARLATIKSFETKFVQQTLDESGEVIQRQTGKAAMLRPRKFLWYVEEPYTQIVTLQADVVSVYEPDIEQITHTPVEDTADTSVVALMFDENDDDLSEYVVSELLTGYRLESLPNSDDLIGRIEVYFSGETINAIDVIDKAGLKTEFTFEEMVMNIELASTLFEIDVPENTEVIGDPPMLESVSKTAPDRTKADLKPLAR